MAERKYPGYLLVSEIQLNIYLGLVAQLYKTLTDRACLLPGLIYNIKYKFLSTKQKIKINKYKKLNQMHITFFANMYSFWLK